MLLLRNLIIFFWLAVLSASDASAMACVHYFVNGAETAVEAGPVDYIYHFEQTGNPETDFNAIKKYSQTRERVKGKYQILAGKDGWSAVPSEQFSNPQIEYYLNRTVKGSYLGGNEVALQIVEFSGEIVRIFLDQNEAEGRPIYMALVRKNGVTEKIPYYAVEIMLIK